MLRNYEAPLNKITPYIHLYWRDMSVRMRCLDKRIAISKAIMDAMVKDIHSEQPGSFAMVSLVKNVYWPYIHHRVLANGSACNACTDICKNLNPVITHKKWSPFTKRREPNEEKQISFGCPVLKEKGIEQYPIIAIDRYSKYPPKKLVKSIQSKSYKSFQNI